MSFSSTESRLAAILLAMAGEKFANHGCNDFDLVEACGDAQAARQIAIAYHARSFQIPESELVIGRDGHVWEEDLLNIPDFGLMMFLADRLTAPGVEERIWELANLQCFRCGQGESVYRERETWVHVVTEIDGFTRPLEPCPVGSLWDVICPNPTRHTFLSAGQRKVVGAA